MDETKCSCETSRCWAYAEELKWRIVYQSYILGLAQRAIAANLNIDRSTVSRILARFEATGDVKASTTRQNHCLGK